MTRPSRRSVIMHRSIVQRATLISHRCSGDLLTGRGTQLRRSSSAFRPDRLMKNVLQSLSPRFLSDMGVSGERISPLQTRSRRSPRLFQDTSHRPCANTDSCPLEPRGGGLRLNTTYPFEARTQQTLCTQYLAIQHLRTSLRSSMMRTNHRLDLGHGSCRNLRHRKSLRTATPAGFLGDAAPTGLSSRPEANFSYARGLP
ncbi:hypothetical protein OH76DRAFT_1064533 [Lentinus brumalis]|uniref:Uncharacterized protein n=1 Tax=Lentinus brumalis TaxID=2498619 RepID=A0A371DNL7_9APHY|nr:hypothetical protein OH76DRAFT_1064533 [Polyporus brumalis]